MTAYRNRIRRLHIMMALLLVMDLLLLAVLITIGYVWIFG